MDEGAAHDRWRASYLDEPVDVDQLPEALRRYKAGGFDGLGFVFGDDWSGVDLDDVLDSATGDLVQSAAEVVTALNSYTETSPGGAGAKVFLRGSLPRREGNRKKGFFGPGTEIEMYDHGRYFATTGRRWPNAPGEVRERTAELAILHERVFGSNGASGPESARTNGNARHDLEEIIETLRAEYGSRFERLWNGDKSDFGDDDSRADLALVSLIAQITDDPATIDAVFRRSKLYRTKWDRKDYRERTIAKALRASRRRRLQTPEGRGLLRLPAAAFIPPYPHARVFGLLQVSGLVASHTPSRVRSSRTHADGLTRIVRLFR
jgi:primase-polymerase (primpol)-like protein